MKLRNFAGLAVPNRSEELGGAPDAIVAARMNNRRTK